MVYDFAVAISPYYFNLLIKNSFNSEILSENYISHDSAIKSPPIRQQNHTRKTLIVLIKHSLSNYLNICICAYFAVNVKYMVFIDIINIFKSLVLHFAIIS